MKKLKVGLKKSGGCWRYIEGGNGVIDPRGVFSKRGMGSQGGRFS